MNSYELTKGCIDFTVPIDIIQIQENEEILPNYIPLSILLESQDLVLFRFLFLFHNPEQKQFRKVACDFDFKHILFRMYQFKNAMVKDTRTSYNYKQDIAYRRVTAKPVPSKSVYTSQFDMLTTAYASSSSSSNVEPDLNKVGEEKKTRKRAGETPPTDEDIKRTKIEDAIKQRNVPIGFEESFLVPKCYLNYYISVGLAQRNYYELFNSIWDTVPQRGKETTKERRLFVSEVDSLLATLAFELDKGEQNSFIIPCALFTGIIDGEIIRFDLFKPPYEIDANKSYTFYTAAHINGGHYVALRIYVSCRYIPDEEARIISVDMFDSLKTYRMNQGERQPKKDYELNGGTGILSSEASTVMKEWMSKFAPFLKTFLEVDNVLQIEREDEYRYVTRFQQKTVYIDGDEKEVLCGIYSFLNLYNCIYPSLLDAIDFEVYSGRIYDYRKKNFLHTFALTLIEEIKSNAENPLESPKLINITVRRLKKADNIVFDPDDVEVVDPGKKRVRKTLVIDED